jgi:3'(2'), 5'-bisphosphate nucleotidase
VRRNASNEVEEMRYELERRVAVEAVLKACSLCSAVQSAHLSGGVADKEDRSPVTVADFGAQAVISDYLAAFVLNVPLVSEEDSGLLKTPGNERLKDGVINYVRRFSPDLKEESSIFDAIDRGKGQGGGKGLFWTLDPIDGTKGFLRGDQYAIALALVEDGQVTLAVMGCPSLPLHSLEKQDPRGCLFAAVRGEGAYARGLEDPAEKKIIVSATDDPREALFCESVDPSHSSHDQMARIVGELGAKRPPLRMDSQAKYGILARGEGTVYFRLPTKKSYVEKIWDHAAGAIIVEEAGGRVTDLFGKPLDFSRGRTLDNNQGIVATNGKLHQRMLQAVKSVISHP